MKPLTLLPLISSFCFACQTLLGNRSGGGQAIVN